MKFQQQAKVIFVGLAVCIATTVPLHAGITFETAGAFALCNLGTLTLSNTAEIGGVTGLKIANEPGSTCSDSGTEIVVVSVGAIGSGSGVFEASLQQLAISYDFDVTAELAGVPTDFDWSLQVNINGLIGSASAQSSGEAVLDKHISSNGIPLLIDVSGLAGDEFANWSVFLTVSKFALANDDPISLTVSIPANSIDINGLAPTVEDVPEPATFRMFLIAAAVSIPLRRRFCK